MQAFVWVIFAALFFVLRLILKSSGKVIDIASDAYKTVNDKNYNSNYKQTSGEQSTAYSHNSRKKVFCIYCGAPNDGSSKFCIKCGKKLDTIEEKKPKNQLKDTVFGYAVTLVAYVAKADGVISENEAEVIGMLLSDMSSGDQEIRKLLKAIYDEAKNAPVKSHTDIARKMMNLSKQEFDPSEIDGYHEIFMKWLVILVYADNKKNLKQVTVVDDIANILQINKQYMDDLYRKFDNTEDSRQNSNSNGSSSSSMDENYKILKCKPTDSDEQIKKAYRELAKQYHPDTINGKGLAEDFILFANQKFKEINSAYDAIKKQRDMG